MTAHLRYASVYFVFGFSSLFLKHNRISFKRGYYPLSEIKNFLKCTNNNNNDVKTNRWFYITIIFSLQLCFND